VNVAVDDAALDGLARSLAAAAEGVAQLACARGRTEVLDAAARLELRRDEARALARLVRGHVDRAFGADVDRPHWHDLARHIRDAIDHLEKAAAAIALAGVDELSEGTRGLAYLATEAAREASAAALHRRTGGLTAALDLAIARTHELDAHAENLLREELASLFASMRDPSEFFRGRDALRPLRRVALESRRIVDRLSVHATAR
jgi:hypothetical protein